MAISAFARGSVTSPVDGNSTVSFSYLGLLNVSEELTADDFTYTNSYNPTPGDGNQFDIHIRYNNGDTIPAGNHVLFLTPANSNLQGGTIVYPSELKGSVYQVMGSAENPINNAIGIVSYKSEIQSASPYNSINLIPTAATLLSAPYYKYEVSATVQLPEDQTTYPNPYPGNPDVRIYMDEEGIPHMVVEYYYPYAIPDVLPSGSVTYPLGKFYINTNIELEYIEVIFFSDPPPTESDAKKKRVKGSANPTKDDVELNAGN